MLSAVFRICINWPDLDPLQETLSWSGFNNNKLKIQGCIFFCLTPLGKYGQITCWGKNDWKGMKKGGEMHIFPLIGKVSIFFPQLTKLHKKGWKCFVSGAHPINIINSIRGKKYKSGRGGGKKYTPLSKLQTNKHRWVLYL